jgi:lipid-A-disaccharide synthase
VAEQGRPLRIALVAGEASGDQLGAALIEALRERVPHAQFMGLAGPRMQAAGCEAIGAAEELAVMGLFEVLEHLPRLWRLRLRLVRAITEWRADVFIGIDAPGFNLGLARQLKRAGLRTVQYVSPQVWAWRAGRAARMGESCDLVLCLLPFEPAFYARHGVSARFVGHPMADQIPLESQRHAARHQLGISDEAAVLALLPGSRRGEVQRLAADFLTAARSLRREHPGLLILAPMASASVREEFERNGPLSDVRVLDGRARLALQAADGGLVASGTASLEALLCGCPMVVAYRFGALTAALLRWLRLVRLPYFSLPNLLAGERLVPEFFQHAVQPDALHAAMAAQLSDSSARERLVARFADIHRTLRVGGAARAADAVLDLMSPSQ